VTAALSRSDEDTAASGTSGSSVVGRWLPLLAGLGTVAAILLWCDTPVTDLAKYLAYAVGAVIVPGTLVYRTLRRTPHTLVEDVAMGVAVGLVLELSAWAAFSALGGQGWLWLWPLAVIVPFATVPALRRHWRPHGYRPTPVGWSWSVAAVVVFFTGYLAAVFLRRNPVLPTGESTEQYLDLAYQLSLAGEAKHHMPLDLPQVAGEPLYYHWFGYAHMGVVSLIGHIDLPVVVLRLAIPALCAAAVVLTAVIGWRVSGRPYAGAAAAALFFVIGEVDFTHPTAQLFGTQATFVVWHGMSMIYSWVLLLALIGPVADVLGSSVPRLGPGAYPLAAALMLASGGAKASSLPVVIAALLFTVAILAVATRRLPGPAVAMLGLAIGAQLVATAVLFHFQTYGVGIGPLQGLAKYWLPDAGRSFPAQFLVVLAVFVAFYVNMELRGAGILALLYLRHGRLDPVQVFLLGGALAGPLIYLTFSQPSGGNEYFTRAGFAFAVLLSAWGYALVFDRARPSAALRTGLGAFAAGLAVVLVLVQLGYAGSVVAAPSTYRPLVPLLCWALLFALGCGVAGLAWRPVSRHLPKLRGRGAVTLLTAVLVFGAPGLVMDAYKSIQHPNGGAYFNVHLPRSRVDAARWVRDHSRPDDVIATNDHCLPWGSGPCDPRVFWLSAYSERSVLVEGWGFAPRMQVPGTAGGFWDPALLARNDAAFSAPTQAGLAALRRDRKVRFLVVDRTVSTESNTLRDLAVLRFDNGRMLVYELRG
jgi:hypothetical protein